MKKITVYDSPMGSGKTEYAIQKMIRLNKEEGQKFIYITPYLDEVIRVSKALKKSGVSFKQPRVDKKNYTKLSSFSKLLMSGENIVTTHALFDRIDEEALSVIRLNQYDLYLDEVFDVISILDDITSIDFKMLVSNKKCEVDATGQVIWKDEGYKGKFNKLKNLCNLGEVYQYSDKLLIYNFPIKVFDKMKDVNVFTFGFKGQIQYGYYKFYKKEMDFKMVYKQNGIYKEREYNRDEIISKFSFVMNKINLYQGSLNMDSIESKAIPLSSSGLTRLINSGDGRVNTLQKMILSYFKNNKPIHPSSKVLWTTLKSAKPYLKGKGYTKGFIPLNLRATNDYGDRIKLAYVYNKFFNPIQANFLKKKGIELDQDKFALVELLQWVFRSRIRRGEEIELYVPNFRMRNLLENWEEYL